jgi:hypothetical protein
MLYDEMSRDRAAWIIDHIDSERLVRFAASVLGRCGRVER